MPIENKTAELVPSGTTAQRDGVDGQAFFCEHLEGHEFMEITQGPPGDLKATGLTLFNNRICPFGQRAFWALEEKKLSYRYIHIEISSKKGVKPAWYKESVNPYGTVPALCHDGRMVYESDLIPQYLEEAFPQSGASLLPKDNLVAISRIRQLKSKVNPGPFYRFGSGYNNLEKDQENLDGLADVLDHLEEMYELQSPDGPYFLGEQFSLAEIYSMTFLERFERKFRAWRDFDLFADKNGERYPRLHKALDACRTRKAFTRANCWSLEKQEWRPIHHLWTNLPEEVYPTTAVYGPRKVGRHQVAAPLATKSGEFRKEVGARRMVSA